MQVRKEFVLVEQVATKKQSKIILSAANDEKEQFDYAFTILGRGEECSEDVQVGKEPIFTKHVQFLTVSLREKTDDKSVVHVVVHQDDIIGYLEEADKEAEQAAQTIG